MKRIRKDTGGSKPGGADKVRRVANAAEVVVFVTVDGLQKQRCPAFQRV